MLILGLDLTDLDQTQTLGIIPLFDIILYSEKKC
jgi:hypothetical protein